MRGFLLLAQAAWGAYEASMRMIGGAEADISQHAFLVFVFHRSAYKQCAGALVAPNAVVTAGHCLNTTVAADYDVRANIHNVSRRAYEPRCVFMTVTRLVLPIHYNRTLRDIGLIFVEPHPDVTTFLALDTTNVAHENATFQAMGWGHTEAGSKSSQVPNKLPIRVLGDDRCRDQFQAEYSPVGSFCGTGVEEKTITCHGDSGGPVFTDDKTQLVGIVSFGSPNCSADSAGFTRVYYFEQWICKKIHPLQASLDHCVMPTSPPDRDRLPYSQ